MIQLAEGAFVHESSYIDDDVHIGANTKIWHFCHVQAGASIGDNCSLGQNVNVANNVHIGNNVKIQNNVSVYEGVEIGDGVFLRSLLCVYERFDAARPISEGTGGI